jgi:hypothetical protein
MSDHCVTVSSVGVAAVEHLLFQLTKDGFDIVLGKSALDVAPPTPARPHLLQPQEFPPASFLLYTNYKEFFVQKVYVL